MNSIDAFVQDQLAKGQSSEARPSGSATGMSPCTCYCLNKNVTVRGEARDIDEFITDNRKMGIGGAPTRCSILPTAAAERKTYPVASGVLDYFPDAIAAISHLSWVGNEQHNPGQPLHWARGKSTDEADTMLRHFLQRGTVDSDGVRHSVKMAWRALALLQKELEQG
jgi:hypothetical protein